MKESYDRNMKHAEETEKRTTNSKPIPHIPLPLKEVMRDVLKVKPPAKAKNASTLRTPVLESDNAQYSSGNSRDAGTPIAVAFFASSTSSAASLLRSGYRQPTGSLLRPLVPGPMLFSLGKLCPWTGVACIVELPLGTIRNPQPAVTSDLAHSP